MAGAGLARKDLIAAQERRSAVQKEVNQLLDKGLPSDAKVALLKAESEDCAREVLRCARAVGTPAELESALADLASIVAQKNPDEAISLATEFHSLSITDDSLRAAVADTLHIAYKSLGNAVRAERQRALAIRLRQEHGKATGTAGATWQGLMAALRSSATPLAGNEKWAIELKQPIDEWLSQRTQISLADLAPSFGRFVSNDREFYRIATDRLQMLGRRLQSGLSKPDNYLLIAQPGLGKSFFVTEFKNQLNAKLGTEVIFLERNLSAYDSTDAAFRDIIMDVLIALITHNPVFLFIDEVDTLLDGKSMLEKLIAPMNGDSFFYRDKQISFSKQNLVVFFALSSDPDAMKTRQKWTDFLSRIPHAHRITLPQFKSPLDRIYRSVSKLPDGKFGIRKVEAIALLYIALRNWTSVRELEQALELAKVRAHSEDSRVLELAHITVSPEDIEEVERVAKMEYGTVDILGGPTNIIDIV
jgi:hypothetical protein